MLLNFLIIEPQKLESELVILISILFGIFSALSVLIFKNFTFIYYTHIMALILT